MRDHQNILDVAALRPNYLGFIFFTKSPRFVGRTFSIPPLASGINKVGVFVNQSLEEVKQICNHFSLDYAQLHGGESLNYCRALKLEGIKLIKVFSLDDRFDFSLTVPFAEVADFFLFDTLGKFFGGNAKTFDWKVLSRYNQEVPFFLSGGLSPENITGIKELDARNLYGLDLNSGVEEFPGYKDTGKVRKAFSAINLLYQ